MHGDALQTLEALPNEFVDLIFLDPPYNLELGKEVLIRPDGTTYAGVREDWDRFNNRVEYGWWLEDVLGQCWRVLHRDGCLWMMGSYHNIFTSGFLLQREGWWLLNDVIWVRKNPVPQFRGVRFCNAHEHLIWAVKSKDAKYTFNYQLMKAANGGKQMRSDWWLPDEAPDLWELPICQGKERLRGADGRSLHPTQKPLALLRRVIQSSTKQGAHMRVLDPFLGTGTSAIAGLEWGCDVWGIDSDHDYLMATAERVRAVLGGHIASIFPAGELLHVRERALQDLAN